MGNRQPALNYFENKLLVATLNYGGYLYNPFEFYSNSQQQCEILKQLSISFYSLIPDYFQEFSSLTTEQRQNFDFGLSQIDQRILKNRYCPLIDAEAGITEQNSFYRKKLMTQNEFLKLWESKYTQIIKNNQHRDQISDKEALEELSQVEKQTLKKFDCLCYHAILKYIDKKIDIKTFKTEKQLKQIPIFEDYQQLMQRFFERGFRFNQQNRVNSIIQILNKDFNNLIKLKKQQKSQVPKLIDVLFIQNPTKELVQALTQIQQKNSQKPKYSIRGKNDLSKCLIVARTASFKFIIEQIDDVQYPLLSAFELISNLTNIPPPEQENLHYQYVNKLVLPKVGQLLEKTKSNLLVCDGYIFLGVNFKESSKRKVAEKIEMPVQQQTQVNPGQSSNIILKQNTDQNGKQDKKQTKNEVTSKDSQKQKSDLEILKTTLQSLRHFKRQMVIIVGGYIDNMIQKQEHIKDGEPLQQIFHYDIYPKYDKFVTSNRVRTFMQLDFQKANLFQKACRSQILSSCSMPKRARITIDSEPINQTYLIPNARHPYLQYMIVCLINNEVKQHQKQILQKRQYLTKYHNIRRKLQGNQSQSGFSQKA